MSFRNIPTNITTRNRKGEGLFLAKNSNHSIPFIKERASAFTSKGSITLEAAIVIPIFFFAMLCMVYLFEVMAVQTSVRSALQSVGKEVAKDAYLNPVVLSNSLESRLVEILGAENLNQSIIVNGADGLDCSHSESQLGTAVMDLNVRYRIEIPVLMFRLPIRTYEERLRVKGWTGYASGSSGLPEEELVYVTEYGLVYHKDLYCSYLEISVRGVRADEIEDLRNTSGGIYYPCGHCEETAPGEVLYITDYGNRYHTSLDCQGVKRDVYVVPLKDVNGLGGCSKCVY